MLVKIRYSKIGFPRKVGKEITISCDNWKATPIKRNEAVTTLYLDILRKGKLFKTISISDPKIRVQVYIYDNDDKILQTYIIQACAKICE